MKPSSAARPAALIEQLFAEMAFALGSQPYSGNSRLFAFSPIKPNADAIFRQSQSGWQPADRP